MTAAPALVEPEPEQIELPLGNFPHAESLPQTAAEPLDDLGLALEDLAEQAAELRKRAGR